MLTSGALATLTWAPKEGYKGAFYSPLSHLSTIAPSDEEEEVKSPHSRPSTPMTPRLGPKAAPEAEPLPLLELPEADDGADDEEWKVSPDTASAGVSVLNLLK
eukprot:g27908.t1